MITQLSGRLVEIFPTHVVIDCSGVGYWVNISLTTYSTIQKEEKIVLYTQQIFREDNQLLYGFHNKQEREVFQKLISVNGVGPASAIMMLSSMDASGIVSAIEQEDAKLLQTIKGIGAKTAQRIILDLKDKLNSDMISETFSPSLKNKSKFEALTALEVLGFPKKSIEAILDKLTQQNPEASVEFLVKETLKKL